MASWLVSAPWGSHTAPSETVADTLPALGFNRLVVHGGVQTLGDQRHFALAAFAQDDAELVPGGPPDDVAAAERPREPLSGRDDHFVGAVEAVGLVDDGKLVDRGDDKGAGALGGGRARNHAW